MPKMRAATGTAAVPGYSAYGFRAGCAPLYEKVKPYYKTEDQSNTRNTLRLQNKHAIITTDQTAW